MLPAWGHTHVHFLVKEDLVLIKTPKTKDHIVPHVGNKTFSRYMNDRAFDIFGPTTHTKWDSQNANLKKYLINYLEGLFGANTFNRARVTSTVGTYLKYVGDMY